MNVGGFPPKPQVQGGFLASFRQKSFWALWAPHMAVFLFLLLFYTFEFMQLPSICILLSFSFLMIAGMLFVFKHEVRTFLPAAMLLPVAVAAGSIGGLYTYDVYAIYPHFYSNARLYTDVQPSLPSGSVGDAGKLIFTPSSFVDINQSAAYVTEYHWGRSKPSRGSIFCAAPVRDLHDIRQMQYWAVGVSCCSQGDFWCDDAKDSKAQGGIVIFDNEGFFSGSSFDEYQKAAKKAEATHHLLSVHHPMYIRWAHKDNLDKVANEYNMKA
ncbi:unnamed protein product, partial [Effrenium voratum]